MKCSCTYKEFPKKSHFDVVEFQNREKRQNMYHNAVAHPISNPKVGVSMYFHAVEFRNQEKRQHRYLARSFPHQQLVAKAVA